MTRVIILLAAASLVTAVQVQAVEDVDSGVSTVSGEIHAIGRIAFTGVERIAPADPAGGAAAQGGDVATEGYIFHLAIHSNTSWCLNVDCGRPAPPGEDEPELLVRIESYDDGTVENGFDRFRSPAAGETAILSHGRGVRGNSVAVQARILPDGEEGSPGDHGVPLIFTIETIAGA